MYMKYFLLGLVLTSAFSPFAFKYFNNISVDEAEEEYDFIIVGGGTTGLVVANRLTEIPNIKVLILEAGEEENLLVSFPFITPFLQFLSTNWGYQTTSQKYSCLGMSNQKSNWPRGKVVGGTSSINYMMYVRGNKEDYDEWEKAGARGWSFKDVLPYFKKSENFTGKNDDINEVFHSRDGPLKTSLPKQTTFYKILAESLKEIGLKKTDYNGKNQQGYSTAQTTKYEGYRVSSASAFLYPIIKSRKHRLHLLTRAHVKKIIFDENKNAKSVEYFRDGQDYLVSAKKEIILSAGSIGTPQILMLSGVGDEQHLKDVQVPLVVNLPGVGSNLQDHIMSPGFFKSEKFPEESIGKDLISLKAPIRFIQKAYDYLTSGEGLFSHPIGAYSLAFIDSAAKNVSWLGNRPDLQLLPLGQFIPTSFPTSIFMKYFVNQDKQVTTLHQIDPNFIFITLQYWNQIKQWQGVNEDKVLCDFAINPVLLHPRSRGRIRLRSNDSFHHPVIDPNYLSDRRDMKSFIEGFRIFEKMEKTKTFKKLKAKLSLYAPQCDSESNRHSPRSDLFYECYIRTFTWTVYHPIGTAKIGKIDDALAVVDSRLRVYKVNNLRVADASVIPEIISGNTQSTCYMIGEKASDMIKEDWKLN